MHRAKRGERDAMKGEMHWEAREMRERDEREMLGRERCRERRVRERGKRERGCAGKLKKKRKSKNR